MSFIIITQVSRDENIVNKVGGGMEIKHKHKNLVAQGIPTFS